MEKIDPNFAVSSHSLRLHGGVAVQVLIFRDKSAHREDSLVPTVVFFSASGNSCYGGEYESIMNRAFVAHYVLFNYPGVADSKGQLKTDAAFSDVAKEVVTFAARELKTPLHRIHLLGRSLGGAVAAGLKGMMPELGSLVLDRSPSSIPDVIRSHIGCSSCCLPILTPLAFDSRKALGRLREERYWVLYHPEDRMIKPEATLKDEPQANVVELRGNPAIEDVHNQPLGIGFGPAVILLLFREVFAAPQRALYQFARGAPPDPSECP
jgi:pimeloyl-ACP methyl ester carboxylesterase